MDIQSPSNGLDPSRGEIKKLSGGKLEAPENIIKSASAAKSLYSIVRTQNLNRIALYAGIEGLIAGNPPYDQADLDQHGLSYITNYNDLSARARFEKECLGYFNLTHQAELIAKFSLHIGDPQGALWAQILSINFDKVIRKWKNFANLLGTHTAQLAKLGISVLLWPDERDWRPRVVQLNRFFVPDQTSTDMDQLTFCFFETDFTAQYLFQAYDEIKNRLTKGEREDPNNYKYFWNVQALEQILLFRANSAAKPNNLAFENFYDLQVALQNGDFSYNQLYGDGIRLVTLLYKEYDGKITHYMFDQVWGGNDFIYMSDRQYHDFSQACAIFTVSPGEFTLHSNRGIGHKVFAPCQAKNQLACSLVDMARYSSTPMLRNNSGAVKDPQQIKMYPGVPTDIGAAEFVQNNLGNNIQQVVGALQFLEQNLNANLGMGGDDPSIPDQSNASVSPTQARLQSYREFSILRDKVAHFYTQMDAVYVNIVSIMLRCKVGHPGYEFVKEWKEKCIAEGVPAEMFEYKGTEWGLPPQMGVKATRVAGDGSTVGMLLGLQEMAPIVGDLSPKAANSYKRDFVLAALGPDAIERYMQDSEEPDEVSGGASLAGAENANMQQGFAPIFSPSNEHKSHFAIHLALNVQTMQKVQQQQIDPIEAQKVFDFSMPHSGEHWQEIVQSPFGVEFANRYKKSWDQIVQYATLNKKNAIKMYEARIKEQQEQAQQQQQVLNDEQLKELQVKGEMERKERESVDKQARQNRESDTRADLKRADIESKAQNDRLKIQLDHGVKRQEVADENSLEQNRIALESLTRVNTPGSKA